MGSSTAELKYLQKTLAHKSPHLYYTPFLVGLGLGDEVGIIHGPILVQWNTDICITGVLHQTDLSNKISWKDFILAIYYLYLQSFYTFASDGFLHKICWHQSDANIRIPLY